ncbi:MAG: YgiT-type zinc finger protein [Anaerolineales bacterium]|jgi:YgiT-type zinc finger domain-containing protein|nr:YgiT-type zinc finger protein [Anaerolineales bacterium]
MICLVCREAQTISGVTSIHFERDEFKALIREIPAQVCPVCGESYLNEVVTAGLLEQVGKMFAEGELDIVQAYT